MIYQKMIYVSLIATNVLNIIYAINLIMACTVMAKRNQLHSNTVFLVLTLYVLIIKTVAALTVYFEPNT